MSADPRLDKWHNVVAAQDWEDLNDMLAEDVEFHSPFVWSPKRGREATAFILRSVGEFFQNFTYQREWVDGNNFALEFSADVDDKKVKGIDLIRWNDEGRIVHFEVMIRPANGLMMLGQKMTAKMEAAGLV